MKKMKYFKWMCVNLPTFNGSKQVGGDDINMEHD